MDSTNVIQMTKESKETSSEFVIPDFDFVIVSTGTNEWFIEMKVHAADRTFVLFETINDCADAVVPPVCGVMICLVSIVLLLLVLC